MASAYEGLYKKEHDLLMQAKRGELAAQHRADELALLLARALKQFKEELLERDVLWDTRAIMDIIEKKLHERHE